VRIIARPLLHLASDMNPPPAHGRASLRGLFLITIRLVWDRKFNQVKSVENVALGSTRQSECPL
jgi:hypothetical protein